MVDIPRPPPPGVVPNFVIPESNAPMTTIVIPVLLPLMLAVVCLRVTRQRPDRSQVRQIRLYGRSLDRGGRRRW